MKTDKKFNFARAMVELEKINQWFQNEDIDLDEGLEKIRAGRDLIKACRRRLNLIENEFTEITGDLEPSGSKASAGTAVVSETTVITAENDSDEPGEMPF